MRADFIVTGPRGAPRVFFEVKRRSQTSAPWARQLRQNILDQAASREADYFAIVTPDALYLWPPGSATDADPVLVSIEGTFREYATRLRQDLSRLSSHGFELLVSAWLGDLVNGLSGTEVPPGLLDAVRGGKLVSEREFDA
jgi:hypothetical protein